PVDAAWAPDGRSLVVGLANGSIVRLQSAALTASPAEPPSVLQAHTHGVLALAWQKAGRLWASSGQDGRVLLWDARLPEPRVLHEERQWSERLAFAERGNALAVATGRTLRVFDETGALRYQHVSNAGAISALAWHPRAAELASAGNGGVLPACASRAIPRVVCSPPGCRKAAYCCGTRPRTATRSSRPLERVCWRRSGAPMDAISSAPAAMS